MPSTKKATSRWVFVVAAVIVVVIGGGIAAFSYITGASKTVNIDQSQIEAPVVDLSSTAGGTLRALEVSAGQTIPPNTVVAQVGVELIKSTAGGLVIATHGD